MKKIAVIFNGGTISMKIDPEVGAAIPSLNGEEIMSKVVGVECLANIETHNFSSLPGPHMSPDLLMKLSDFVKNLLCRNDIDGVVLTHGTDSLEETAYLLDLTINSLKPIVVTGSMKNSSELGYDGPANLADSICTAATNTSCGRGVLVCFDGEIFTAAEATKANSMKLSAFQSPDFGPIGIVDNHKVFYYRNVEKRKCISTDKLEPKVALIKTAVGMDSEIIEFYISSGYKGIVIEGMGRGNVPPLMLSGIIKALNNGMAVVLVTRCFSGNVCESYGYSGGGKELKNLGVIFGDYLNGQKARIKLMVALGSTSDLEEVNKYF